MAPARIGFLGGSFDPPHRGHLAVALAARDRFALDRVLLAPTGRQPLKPDGAVAAFDDRLQMVRLLCEGAPNLEASDADAPNADGAPNFTINTLERLQHTLTPTPGDTIFVLVGADAFLDLRRWREPERLLELAEWIVVTRPGVSLDRLSELHLTDSQQSRVHLLDGVAEEVSATDIRDRLRAGDDCAGLLPPTVLQYIRKHHLYET